MEATQYIHEDDDDDDAGPAEHVVRFEVTDKEGNKEEHLKEYIDDPIKLWEDRYWLLSLGADAGAQIWNIAKAKYDAWVVDAQEGISAAAGALAFAKGVAPAQLVSRDFPASTTVFYAMFQRAQLFFRDFRACTTVFSRF